MSDHRSGAARRGAVLGLAAFLALGAVTGCVGSPTPLAPGLHGSVGSPNLGVITDGVALPKEGKGFRRLRPWSTSYVGTPGLVKTLELAGSRVAPKETDPPLLVGDIAAPRGGKLPGHASHRSGRDVDLLFFYTTPSGVPVPSPGFVKVGADGLAQIADAKGISYVRLDVPRTWELAKALLESPHADVAWLFVAEWVEALLIDYARAKGESPHLVWRAESVMLQPKDSFPHDDHFHLRVRCTDDEAVAGCVDGAPHWPWLPARPTLRDDVLAETLRELSEG